MGGSMGVQVVPEVASLLRGRGERAVTVDLTLQFCGDMVRKDVVAVPGSAPPGSDFELLSLGGIDLFWRQRISLSGLVDPYTTYRVRPRFLWLVIRQRTIEAKVMY